MSLGVTFYSYLKSVETTEEMIIEERKKIFLKEFKKIKNRDNVDPTFGYFCLIKDQKINEKKWYKYNPNQSIRNKDGIKVKNFAQAASTGRALLKCQNTLEYCTNQDSKARGESKITSSNLKSQEPPSFPKQT